MALLDTIIHSTPITKGWSEDKKYCVTVADGTKYLLRITPIQRYDTRKALFEMLGQVSALGIPMCHPVEFGTCPEGVYALHSWVDGEDAEVVIPHLPEAEQYAYGLQAGKILKKIHTLPAPDTQEAWATRFNRKTNHKIETYHACGVRFAGDECVIEYIENNRPLLEGRPQCFQHGDFHIGNLMIEHNQLTVIDFDRFDFGDPWEEFNRIVWCAPYPHFATGIIHGYFDGYPPDAFWQLLAFYIFSNTLSSIPWAIPFGQADVDVMQRQARDVLMWFCDLDTPVPTWYLKHCIAPL